MNLFQPRVENEMHVSGSKDCNVSSYVCSGSSCLCDDITTFVLASIICDSGFFICFQIIHNIFGLFGNW